MKKLFLLLLLPLFFSCSNADDQENVKSIPSELIGRYISEEGGIEELFTLELKEGTGTWENYNKGKLNGNQSFAWYVLNGEFVTIDSNNKVEQDRYNLSRNSLALGEVVYRKVPGERFESISGHTYIAVSWVASTHDDLFLIYNFKKDGTIEIEERLHSIDGNISMKYPGKYEVINDEIKIDTQSILGCDDCFNHFTAILHKDKKSFTYEINDISIGKKRTLFFYASK